MFSLVVRAARPPLLPAPAARHASFLSSLFRRSRAPGGIPALSLFDQTSLPEPLRLPLPADPLARLCAGIADGAVAAAGAAAAFYGAGAAGVAPADASAAAQAAFLLLWAVRDALGDGGNRSLGKRAFNLELTHADGSLASRSAALSRSWYVLLVPAAGAHPFVGLSLELFLFFDVATLVLTPDARKAGDYMFGTRVVRERAGRRDRLADAADAVEATALREEIEAAAPGLLAQLAEETRAPRPWWELEKSALAGPNVVAGSEEVLARKDASPLLMHRPKR